MALEAEIGDLRALQKLLSRHTLQNAGQLKNAAARKISRHRFRNVLIARAYYLEIYLEFFRESEMVPITVHEVFTDLLINETVYLSTSSSMCAQVLLRCFRSIRTDPKIFARALLRSYKELSMYLFAFSTFPAVFQFFTSSENVDYAATFVSGLISMDAPKDLVVPLFKSLLFSSYSFTDALWTNLHRKFASKSRVNAVTAITGLCDSISCCVPLLSNSIFLVVQQFLGQEPVSCCSAVLLYLRITFELWFNHSADGMSFGCGVSFLEFLDGSKDFLVGNSVTIVGSIINCKHRIPVCPSNAEFGDNSSEPVVMSLCDFDLFKRAFESVEPRIPLFETVVVTDVVSRFCPYLLDYFPVYETKRAPFKEHPVIMPGNLPVITLHQDSIFEQAIGINIVLPSLEFTRYTLKKAIIDAQMQMEELEDFLRLKVSLRNLRDFQRSIVRVRNYCFSRYCRKLFRDMNAGASPIGAVAKPILSQAVEVRRLVHPFLSELMNFSVAPDLPPDLNNRFRVLRANYQATAWNEILTFPGIRRVFELVPELTNRQLDSVGDIFLLFGKIFWSIRIITKHFASPQYTQKLMKFLALNSQFDGVLKFFLFFDKFVLQTEFFTSIIAPRVVEDWNLFGKMMLSTISQDDKLLMAIFEYADKNTIR
jgi:hypothetical protein